MKRAPWLVAAALLAACGEDGPRAGELSVRLTGPLAPRAIIVELVGAHQAVLAPTGTPYSISEVAGAGDTARLLIYAPAGSGLSGEVARIPVADVRASRLTATVLEVAGPSYQLVDRTQFTLELRR